MQVNTRAAHDTANHRMSSLQAEMDRLQASIATGKRILAPDDDPVGAARVTLLERRLAVHAADRTGIDRATSRLNAADAALGAVGGVLDRVKDLALQGANATLSPADRATLAGEVGQLAEQLAGYANARGPDGGTLFAGARTGSAAYAPDAAGRLVWQGAGTTATLVLDTGAVATSLDGPAVFEGLPGGTTPPPLPRPVVTDVFAMLTNLRAALTEPDAKLRAHGLANALTGVDAAVSRTADSRAAIGTRLARLEAEDLRLDAAGTALETDLSKTESLDMSVAITRLQRLVTVLQATQLSFARTSALSLWDVLR